MFAIRKAALLREFQNVREAEGDVIIINVTYVEGADARRVDKEGFWFPDMDIGASGGVLALACVLAQFLGFYVCVWE